MIKYFKICFLIFILVNCKSGTFESVYSEDEILFQTDRTEYFRYEDINIKIENKTNDSFEIAFWCSTLIKMNYQVLNDNEWSKNQKFKYTAIRCPTIPIIMKTIESDSIYNYTLSAGQIKGLDTFRLVLHVNFYTKSEIDSVFSNQFQIILD